MSDIVVRKTLEDDVGALEAIIDSCDNFSDDEKDLAVDLLGIYLEERALMAELNEPVEIEYNFLTAEIDNIISGFVCYGEASFAQDCHELYFIVVDAKCRKKGVGKALFKGLCDKMGPDLRMIVADTSTEKAGTGVRAFYGSCAMAEESSIKDFYEKGNDKIFFVKRF